MSCKIQILTTSLVYINYVFPLQNVYPVLARKEIFKRLFSNVFKDVCLAFGLPERQPKWIFFFIHIDGKRYVL